MLMTCRHVQKLRDAYLDGALSSSLMAEVHAHLLQCPACQRQVEMIRACGSVIANDRSEPELPPGFADRVVASLPRVTYGDRSLLVTRRERRQRLLRMGISASLPAAAAMLFFCVLIWPVTETGRRGTIVKGAAAVKAVGAEGLVNSTLEVIEGTKRAAEDVNRLLEISMQDARRGVRAGLERVHEPPPQPTVSFTDIFLEPFRGLLDVDEPPDPERGEPEVVRF